MNPNELRWMLQALHNQHPPPLLRNKLRKWIHLRKLNVPLQYILGSQPFLDLDFKLRRGILIPRPETEFFTNHIINLLSKSSSPPNVLDLCCGSGCIGISIQKYLNCKVTCVDIDPRAISLTRLNARKLNASISAIVSDVTNPLPFNNINYIICNPPYIPQIEYVNLDKSVLEFESKHALTCDDDGMFVMKKVLENSCDLLVTGGVVFLETNGDPQLSKIQEFSTSLGFKNEISMDIYGVPRFLIATK